MLDWLKESRALPPARVVLRLVDHGPLARVEEVRLRGGLGLKVAVQSEA